jgi:hypothetical protein
MLARILIATVLTLGTLLAATFGVAPGAAVAQDAEDAPASEVLFRVDLADDEYPINPAFVRLLRITMAENALSPLHTHPGPEFGLIEQGTLTVQVNGEARIITGDEDAEEGDDGTPTAGSDAPIESEFELGAGELIAYMPQTPMTFRNADADPVSILAAVLLPAGHQHPPGITYVDGQPNATAFEGVSPEILGDGVATTLPRGGITVTLERLRIAVGEPIPAFSDPVLLSLESGVLDFEVVGGKVQVSRTATPGPQPDLAPETEISLAKGDAAFFPVGMREVDRSGIESDLVLLRLTLTYSGDDPAPTPAETGPGEIRIIEAGAAETPEATPSDGTPEPAASPTPEPEPEEEDEPQGLGEGALVEATAESVNVRSGAGTGFEVTTQVFTGQQMRITGDSEEADGYVWWPIELVDDPTVTGYIVEDFIQLVED